jgi:hypothetical protein
VVPPDPKNAASPLQQGERRKEKGKARAKTIERHPSPSPSPARGEGKRQSYLIFNLIIGGKTKWLLQ